MLWFVLGCQELMPGTFEPTPAHYFMALLQKKGLLLRCFTQNIDSLEQLAGLPAEYIVAAHGNFDSEFVISSWVVRDSLTVVSTLFSC